MSSDQSQACICGPAGYSARCPNSFVQGGQLLHAVSATGTTKYTLNNKENSYNGDDGDEVDERDSLPDLQRQLELVTASLERANMRASSAANHLNRALGVPTPEAQVTRGIADLPYQSSEHMKLGGQEALGKFKPLTLGGVSINEATIGGYKLDMQAMAKKAAEIVPLPPVALPMIFRDPDLNFFHLFFQGLETLCGREFITLISEVGRYSAGDDGKISPLLKDLIESGYKETDDDLTVFVKRVMSTTFELVNHSTLPAPGITFLVASNFYGFQYIECGMQCKEQDLKMWLHSAHNQYRNQWFNNFKSSGIPAFALEGVQDRYETVKPAARNGGEIKEDAHALLEIKFKDLEERIQQREAERRARKEARKDRYRMRESKTY